MRECTAPNKQRPISYLKGLAIFIVATMIVCKANANPVLDVVTSGNATVSQTPTTTQINQTSQNAIIEWKSFNIGANESTHFQQPTGGVALNRINPNQGVSQIFGQLSATGKIILINQAGIYFGPTASVDVGGLIASTSNISNANFLAGKYIFDQPSTMNGTIINQGTITAAQHGLVALIGSNVSNEGYIQANLGNVVLASGSKFTVDLNGDGLINFSVDAQATSAGVDQNGNPMRNGVNNSGTIIADGGTILMTAQTAEGVVDHVINMSGVAQANSVAEQSGIIILSGGTEGVVNVSGKIIASGKSSGEKGGQAHISGKYILLTDNAEINVSGDQGGGEVLIGGDYQGKYIAPDILNATATVVSPTVNLLADAITSGDGGKVIVWSDEATKFYGSVSARGGENIGNGGLVETSGKQWLDVAGARVDLTAPHGLTGTWLLDPRNVTISTGSTTGGTFNSASPNVFTPSSDDAIVNTTDIVNNLNLASVTITTGSTGVQAGNITVSNAITNNSTANTLWLNAANNIVINAGISLTSGSLKLTAVNSANSITTGASGTINVKNFEITQGKWAQNTASLPSFNVSNNFVLDNGSLPSSNVEFLRAAGGSGTSIDPYLMQDVWGLQGIGSSSNLLSKSYQLTQNIDASSTSNWNSGAGFIPIGTQSTPFTGGFNGNYFPIDSLYIHATSLGFVGFFGFANLGSNSIQKTFVLNVNVTGDSTADNGLGGLVGRFDSGTVSNSYVSGTVTQNAATAVTCSTGCGVGGLVGVALGDVDFSGSAATVNAAYGVGGLVGFSDHAINNSYALGNVTGNDYVGGLIGFRDGSTTNSYSTGLVTGVPISFVPTIRMGGVAGFAGNASATNTFWDTNTSGQSSGVGVGGSFSGVGKTTTQMLTLSTFTSTWGTATGATAGGITGTVSTTSTQPNYTWFMFDGSTRPMLLMEYNTSINTPHQLQLAGTTLGANYTLARNIDMSVITNPKEIWGTATSSSVGTGFVPIGGASGYTGTFNGNSKIISNLYENKQTVTGASLGLFDLVSGGTIENVGVTNVSLTAAESDNANFGALVGFANSNAIITNSFSTGEITVTGFGNQTVVGGLVGTIFPGTLTNSYSSVNIIASASADGLTFDLGGLLGRDLSTSTVNANYATGAITFNNNGHTSLTQNIGGFEGLHAGSGSITNNYWDSDTGTSSSITTNSIGTAQTTAQLQSGLPSGFGGSWSIIAGSSYPYLNSFYTSTPRAISGSSDAAVNTTITIASNGTNLSTSGFSIGTTLTGTNGYYYFLEGNGIVSDSSPLLVANSGGTANAVTIAPASGGSIKGLTLTTGQLNVGDNNTNTISNTTLSNARTSSNAVYSVASSNVTLNNNTNFNSTSNTTYNLNGNITGSGTSNFTFNGPVSLSAAVTLALGSGTLTLNDIAGNSNALTLTANSTSTLVLNANSAQTWNLSGSNSGSVSGISGLTSLSFSNFGSLTSGAANDSFLFANGASVTGTINGGGGTNSLNLTAYSTPVQVTFTSASAGSATNNGSTIVQFSNMNEVLSNNSGTLSPAQTNTVVTAMAQVSALSSTIQTNTSNTSSSNSSDSSSTNAGYSGTPISAPAAYVSQNINSITTAQQNIDTTIVQGQKFGCI